MLERFRAWVPLWWRGSGGTAGWLLDHLLWPAEIAYRGVVHVRNSGYDRRILSQATPPIPVISIGNIGVGGAGKTPFAAWTATRMRAWGRRPAVVLRGYGTDEILVHQELNPEVPVFAARRRQSGVAAAAKAGCDTAILDDAFQHRSLARGLDIVLIGAESWTPPFRLLPRGPWREDRVSLRRADIVIITRKTASAAASRSIARELARIAPRSLFAICRLEPTRLEPLFLVSGGAPLSWLQGRSILAVASLADPGPFVEQLKRGGAQVELLAYPDHHSFDGSDVAKILAVARDRALVMTRKEAVKLRSLLPAAHPAMVLDQRVEVEWGGAELDLALRRAAA